MIAAWQRLPVWFRVGILYLFYVLISLNAVLWYVNRKLSKWVRVGGLVVIFALLLPPTAHGQGTVIFSDDFNRADAATLGTVSGHTWQYSHNPFEIVGGQAYGPSTITPDDFAYVTLQSDLFSVDVDIPFAAFVPRVMWHYVDDNNLTFWSYQSGSWKLYNRVAGTYTMVHDSGESTYVTHVKVSVSGSSVVSVIQGVTYNDTITTNLTGSGIGFGAGSHNDGHDNFIVTSTAPTPTPGSTATPTLTPSPVPSATATSTAIPGPTNTLAPTNTPGPTATVAPTSTGGPSPTATVGPVDIRPQTLGDWELTARYALALIIGKLIILSISQIPNYQRPLLLLVDYAILAPFVLMDMFIFYGNMHLMGAAYLPTVFWLMIFCSKLMLGYLTGIGAEK